MKQKTKLCSTGHGTGVQHRRDLHSRLEAERAAKRETKASRQAATAGRMAAKIGDKIRKNLGRKSIPVGAIYGMAVAAAYCGRRALGQVDEPEA